MVIILEKEQWHNLERHKNSNGRERTMTEVRKTQEL